MTQTKCSVTSKHKRSVLAVTDVHHNLDISATNRLRQTDRQTTVCALLCPAISFLHFHVLQFHVLQIGRQFHVRHFHVQHFQRPRVPPSQTIGL